MLFGRIAIIGIMLATISAGVIQIRLMNAATSREIHLLVADQQDLQRQLWQQEMELARLRTPQRIAERLASTGTDFLAPGTKRASDLPPRQASGSTTLTAMPTPTEAEADGPAPAVPTDPAAPSRHAGGSTHSWPSHPTHSNLKKAAH